MSALLPRILIRDDGELDEVRAVLDELRIDYAEGGKQGPGPLPSHMLITSGAWAVEAVRQIARERGEREILHLIVIDRASRSLRALLARHGCDMIARRPLHPSVVQLLVQRALYRGDEKRSNERVAIGEPVKLKFGLLARAATLAELSARGCGLITSQRLDVGTDAQIMLGRGLTGGAVLSLACRVVGAKHDHSVESGQHAIAFVFTSMTRGQQQLLRSIMRSRAVGRTGALERSPGTSPVHAPASHSAARSQPPASEPPTSDPRDRRLAPRGHYAESVLARVPGATHSLLGRDLSIGGMRVACEAALGLGDRLQLAIFGQGGVRPVMVAAKVVRDDGEHGLGLRFETLANSERARLQKIVDALKGLEGSGADTGLVISEVIEQA